MPKFSYKTINVSVLEKGVPEAVLVGLGQDGWELVSVDNGTAYLKKAELPPAMQMPIVPFTSPTPTAPAAPLGETDGARHWLPRTDIGEHRYEMVSTQESGLTSAPHKHVVYVILDSNRSIVRGKTDNVLGHEHDVKVLGTTEESDGHTHRTETYPK